MLECVSTPCGHSDEFPKAWPKLFREPSRPVVLQWLTGLTGDKRSVSPGPDESALVRQINLIIQVSGWEQWSSPRQIGRHLSHYFQIIPVFFSSLNLSLLWGKKKTEGCFLWVMQQSVFIPVKSSNEACGTHSRFSGIGLHHQRLKQALSAALKYLLGS